MGDLTATGTVTLLDPQHNMSVVIIETPATADSSDTFKLTLGSYGLKTVIGVTEWQHGTTDNVIVAKGANQTGSAGMTTTSVSSGVMTLTLGSATDNKHVYMVVGRGK